MKKYQIYIFLDQNNNPYYVGMTCNYKVRKQEHSRKIRQGKIKYWKYNKARKLIEQGHPFTMKIIHNNIEGEEEACKLEQYYIKYYRDMGHKLTNMTKGGDLPPSQRGKKRSLETCALISEAKKGYSRGPLSEETKKRISESNKGKRFSKEHKAKLSKARKKRITKDSTRIKCSKTSKGKINIKKYVLWDPYGKQYVTTEGLTRFCEDHNLNHPCLFKVLNGTVKSYKGWKIKRYEECIKGGEKK